MDRDINLTIHTALHIITNNERSNLANTWGKIAVKWQDKLAVRSEDSAVIFKLVRDDDDPKILHLQAHEDYYDVLQNCWRRGWAEANAKTKFPEDAKYPYIIKIAKLRSNEEYRALHNARWGDEQQKDATDKFPA